MIQLISFRRHRRAISARRAPSPRQCTLHVQVGNRPIEPCPQRDAKTRQFAVHTWSHPDL